MEEQKIVSYILNKIKESQLIDSYDLVGGYYGKTDDSGALTIQIQQGYRQTDKPIVIASLSDISNSTESLNDTAIFNLDMTLSFLVRTELARDFYKNLYNFRKEFNSTTFKILDDATGSEFNSVIKIDLPEKTGPVEDTGSVSYIEYDLAVVTLTGEDVEFGNDTDFKIRIDLTKGLNNAVLALKDEDLTGYISSTWEQENNPREGYRYITKNIPAVALEVDNISVTDGQVYTLPTYEKIKNLIIKDDNSGLATIAFQRRQEERSSSVDNGAAWGTNISVILDTKNLFHREMVEQNRNIKNAKKFNLEITIPTFEPYYRKIILDSVAQASPIGGLIALSASVKEIR